jgi:hypothetical protein
MSEVVTIPLQKFLPSLSDSMPHPQWASIISDYLNENTKDVFSLVTHLENAIHVLEHQKKRTSLIIAVLEECGGLTIRARNLMGTPADKEKFQKNITEFEDQFKMALVKLDDTVHSSTIENINLMSGGSLTTTLDAKGQTKLVTEGINLTTASLGIRQPNFSSAFLAQNSRIDVMNAIDIVVTIRNTIASHIASISLGIEVAHYATELSESARPYLSGTNLNDEIKKLIALGSQTEEIFGTDPLAEPAQQEILNHFASSPSMEEI